MQPPVPDSNDAMNIGTAMTPGVAIITPMRAPITSMTSQNTCIATMSIRAWVTGTSFAKQNIITYTIGFALTDETKLLYRTAVNGGGEYFTAKNYSALKEAFKQIMSAIVEKNSCFVAPVVPVSRMNRTYAGNKIYLGFFKPQQEGNWYGNIKRYKLEDSGAILDSHVPPLVATNSEGLIKDEARSWWTSLGDDGPAVEKGGAAERLEIQIGLNARTIYTYTGSQALLTDASNAFVTGNTAITNSMLGVNTAPDRDKLFDIVRKDSFGDVIHSEPAVVFYSKARTGFPDTADDDVKIFVGTNDGQLHCIDDATGNEVWSFVPPDQLGRLLLLNDNSPDHDYFVDGSPTVYYGASQKDPRHRLPAGRQVLYGARHHQLQCPAVSLQHRSGCARSDTQLV